MLRALSFVSASVVAANLFLAAPAAGQIGPFTTETAVTGTVRYAFFPTAGSFGEICGQPTYAIEYLEGTVYLTSANIDLELYIDQLVKVHGDLSSECPVLNVTSVEAPPPASLAICGTAGFGCPMRLVSGPDGLATHWFLVSAAPGFVPLNPIKGAFLLTVPFTLIGPVSSTSFGSGTLDFTVPTIPALAGQTIWFQSARRAASIIGPGTTPPVQFGNLVNMQVAGFVLLCIDPDC